MSNILTPFAWTGYKKAAKDSTPPDQHIGPPAHHVIFSSAQLLHKQPLSLIPPSTGYKMSSHVLHPKYRPDIDGLRAIAVLSVVAFHAFPEWIKGGFIGVDVFFVISGYLISTIIFENIEKGTFSFFEFYSRRIRRIFPALLLVLSTIYAIGWFTLLADEYALLGKHIAAGAAFISNFILWSESGYFDRIADTKPLLHLWSLGIEEQFYIIYPAIIWIIFRKKKNIITITLIMLILSFYINISNIKAQKIATFYSPQTRFWELMLGGILAWWNLNTKTIVHTLLSCRCIWPHFSEYASLVITHKNKLCNMLSASGATILLYWLIYFNKTSRFPGKWALIPTLCSVSIIAAGQNTWFNKKILSNRFMVWIGLISFPLYLWHWPLLSLLRIIHGETPNLKLRLTAVIASAVLAWATYVTIESPIRRAGHDVVKTATLSLFMVLAGIVGYSTFANHGFPFRKDASLQRRFSGDIGHTEYYKHLTDTYFPCAQKDIADDALTWEGYTRCIQSKQTADIDIAIIGDSHAEHLFLGLADTLSPYNIAFYIKGSPPFLDNPDFQKIFAYTAKSESIKKVILTMDWFGRKSQIPSGSTLAHELKRVVDFFTAAGKDVILTDDVPTFPFDAEKCMGIRRFSPGNACEIPYLEAHRQRITYIDDLLNVTQTTTANTIMIEKYICNDSNCSMVDGNTILYRDTNHLNIFGSLLIGRRIAEDNKHLFQ